jgi:uncharacterized protein YndB with AHSA1/START domain
MKRLILSAAAAIGLMTAGLSAAPADPLVQEAVVNASVDAVWKAWTTKAGLEAWLVAKTEIDLKVGGIWRTSYSKDSNLNDDMAIHQTILSFDPGRMFSFRTTKIPQGFPFPGITNAWTVLYFESVGAGKTRVIARMMGFGDDEPSRNMRAFFERGNRSELDKMIKFFESGVPAVVR